MGGEIYNISYKNAGYEGGANGSGAKLNYVTIVVEKGTNKIITAFPSNGTYGIEWYGGMLWIMNIIIKLQFALFANKVW